MPVVGVVDQAAASDVEDERQDETAEEDPAETAPVLPSFGLIFQAPDLSDVPRLRSRRP